jgi:hypothetical protein
MPEDQSGYTESGDAQETAAWLADLKAGDDDAMVQSEAGQRALRVEWAAQNVVRAHEVDPEGKAGILPTALKLLAQAFQ